MRMVLNGCAARTGEGEEGEVWKMEAVEEGKSEVQLVMVFWASEGRYLGGDTGRGGGREDGELERSSLLRPLELSSRPSPWDLLQGDMT